MLAQAKPLRKIAQGREAEMFEWEDGTVLRLGRGPHANDSILWQRMTMERAAASGVRVPRVYDTVDHEGRTGLVMERIDGIDLLTLVGRQPHKMWWVADVAARVHARMHDLEAVPEIEPLHGRIQSLIGESDRVPDKLRDFAQSELAGLPEGDRVLHGDFHPGNIMMAGDEPVVIDWSNISRGDPAADVARTWLMHQHGSLPPGTPVTTRVLAAFGRRIILAVYMRNYRKHRPLDDAFMRRWALVRAVDRLAEYIPEEREAILGFIKNERRKQRR